MIRMRLQQPDIQYIRETWGEMNCTPYRPEVHIIRAQRAAGKCELWLPWHEERRAVAGHREYHIHSDAAIAYNATMRAFEGNSD